MLIAAWLTGLGAAITLKLTSSIDDVVWLAPFLTSNVSSNIRMQNAGIYVTVCIVQTIVAMLIAYTGNGLLAWLLKGKDGAWSSDKILTVGAGCMLAVYGVHLTYEYIQEMREGTSDEEGEYDKVATEEGDNENGKAPREIEMADQLGPGGSPTDSQTAPLADGTTEASIKKDKEKQGTLYMLAFIGSIDDLTLFVPMLVGKAFDLAQLMLGAFISASAIALVCIFIGMCKPIADCLGNIPLALIVAIFATGLLCKGLTMS